MNLNMLEQLYLLAGFGNTVFPDEMEQGAWRGRFEFLCLDRWMDGWMGGVSIKCTLCVHLFPTT